MKAGLLYLLATAIILARAVVSFILSSLPPEHRLTWLLKSDKLHCANVDCIYIIIHVLYSVEVTKLFR